MSGTTRRTFLRAAGATGAVGLAGCSGRGSGTRTVPGSDYPTVDDWLTETEVGGAADNYEGTLLDWTGRDSVTVEVGTEGNQGYFAYDPPGIVVSAGTEVTFSWTGEGGAHNVAAEPEHQLGESDYEFESGEPEEGSDVRYRVTVDEPGIALYHCHPHLSLGMKGGIAVR